jgi:alpha-L-fucosidase 2
MNLKIRALLAASVCTMAGASAQVLPTFSSTDSPAWYYVQFTKGGHNLADQGSGSNLLTATSASTDAQKWQLIGSEDGFKLRSKLGNYVTYSTSAGRYATTDAESSATTLTLTANGSNWEIGRSGQSNHMNQWAGTDVGVQLGEWNAGDNNNLLTFLVASAILPQFAESTTVSDTDQWYFIQFQNSQNTVASGGVGNNALQASIARSDEQLWKLVGTKDNFQLINRLGEYASVTGSGNYTYLTTSTEAYAGGFSLVETTNSSYIGWEIKINDVSDKAYMNQFQGASVGNPVGFWSIGDQGNPVQFVTMESVKYADYNVIGASNYSPISALTLWYNQPATLTDAGNKWMEYSLPIGNGQLGASLYGGVLDDEIQFNEKTLWTGGPNDMGTYGQYKNFGSIHVENLSTDLGYDAASAVKDYVRYLDIERGVAGVKFSNANATTNYERTYIASNPDNVVAAHYVATGANKLSLRFTVTPGDGISASDVTYANGEGSFSGKLTTVSYNARFRVVPVGTSATITSDEDGVTVTNADEVLLILAAATDFDSTVASRISGTDAIAGNVTDRINAAASKGWSSLLADHVADFTNYMGRVSLRLGDAASTLPTNELITSYNGSGYVTGSEASVLFLEQLYFAYGRYLEISSSRGVNVPSNLQGIWNNLSSAPWNADIHSNINVQMNYWPAEPTNLSEMHLPFLNYIIDNAQSANWKKAATSYGGVTNGWTCFTENNIFGGMSTWGTNYFVANAWYCSHLWQHYLYTLDKEFLARAFPVMWSCAQFWMERMIEDRVNNDGTYVCPDEYSPEQDAHNKEDGTAHSQQLVTYLFDSVKKSIDILGQSACSLTDDEVAKLEDYISKTDTGLHTETFKGGDWATWGTSCGISTGDVLLREWKYADYDVSTDKSHRHMSHLMALYPLDQINSSSEYFTPAVNSLKLRGDEATGWSMGWKVNLWARAHDGDHAHVILKNALKHSTAYTTNQYAGGIYYNLYDSHAPFQIDGNFGVCAGIAEMLMQSHGGVIDLLPALPSVWAKGEIKGLKAQGDFTVNITWADGKIATATITSNQGQPLTLANSDILNCRIAVNGSAADVKVDNNSKQATSIETKAGDVITVTYDASFENELAEQTDKIETAAAPKATLNVSNRTVTISGANVNNVKVFDLQGRKVVSTKSNSFTIPAAAGSVVMVSLTDAAGNTTTHKLKLQ